MHVFSCKLLASTDIGVVLASSIYLVLIPPTISLFQSQLPAELIQVFL